MSKNDSVMTMHRCKIRLPKLSSTLILQPFGDIHWGVKGCDTDRFRAFLKSCRKEDKGNTYYISMGDETDTASWSERCILADGRLHDSTTMTLDEHALDVNRKFLKEIEFMRGKLIGMVQGNHHWLFQNRINDYDVLPGMTSTEWLAGQLDTRWLGFLSYIRLEISFDNTTKTIPIDLVVCHGRAGSKLVGTSINQVGDMRQIFPGAQILLFGHDHARGALPVTDLWVPQVTRNGDMRLRQRQIFLGRTGSFLKGYVPGEQSYIVSRLLRPSDLGVIKFEIKFIQNARHDYALESDIHCWE